MWAVPKRSVLAGLTYAALAATDFALTACDSPTKRRFRLITKPLLMPALGTAFMTSLNEHGVHQGGLLRGGTVAAQAMSGVGDMTLLSKSDPAFLAGVGAFAGAHVAYTTAFVCAGRPVADSDEMTGVFGATAAFAALGPLMGWAAGRTSPGLGVPVFGYAGLLLSMFAASTRLSPEIPTSAQRKVFAGTASFVLSDTILAFRKFLLHDTSPKGEAALMATYTLGQGLIAAGVAEAVIALDAASS
jgi:uncharacterized membrane protein YhhN